MLYYILLQVTPQQFMHSPSDETISGLYLGTWTDYVRQELSTLNDEIDLTDRTVYLCMKLAQPLTLTTKKDVKAKVFALVGKTGVFVALVVSNSFRAGAPTLHG